MNLFRQQLKQVINDERLVARFNLKHHRTDNLGDVFRPEVEVKLWSDQHQEWQRYSVLLDTGADYTIFPRYVASLLGVKFSYRQLKSTVGIGGEQKVFFVPELKLKIGQAERIIPVGFVDSNQVPLLLGRHRALETFVVLFNRKKDVFIAQ